MEQKIKEHAAHHDAQYVVMRQFVTKSLHTKDPRSSKYFLGVNMLHDLDSLSRIRTGSPERLVQIAERLKTYTKYSRRFSEIDLSFLEDMLTTSNRDLQFDYYKAKLLSAFMEELMLITGESPCMCIETFKFIQDYNPVTKDHLIHFGSFGECADIYYHIKVNDRIARDGEFNYTPMRVGIDSLLIEIERFDDKTNVIVQDTFYYPIEIVESSVDFWS